MKKHDLIKRFEAGLDTGDPQYGETWLVDEQRTKDNVLYLQAYDANLWPCTNFSTWRQGYIEQVTEEILHDIGDLNVTIWLDDIKVRDYQEKSK